MFNLVLLTSGTTTTFDLANILQTGAEAVQNNIFVALGIIVPIAMAIVGAIVSVKFGLKWLRSLGK